MKANEAPEKLYIDFRDRAESTWRCAYTEKALANDIEYIRKDAFIEKAYEYLSYHLDTNKIDVNYKFEFIEEFKNYIKGE